MATKIEREERKAAEAAALVAKENAIALALDDASSCIKPPPELSTWGVVKTRCWASVYDKLSRACRLKRKNVEQLNNLILLMREMNNMTPDECQQVIENLKARAAIAKATSN